jgi:hypothetical protein
MHSRQDPPEAAEGVTNSNRPGFNLLVINSFALRPSVDKVNIFRWIKVLFNPSIIRFDKLRTGSLDSGHSARYVLVLFRELGQNVC